ncbi:MAG: hypothetical protein AAGD07_09410 [Planctomycetota bacterium]
MDGTVLRFATLLLLAWAMAGSTHGQGVAGRNERWRIGIPKLGHSQRDAVIDALPLDRLTPAARDRILRIAKKPTIYRRLPTQAVACSPEMFLFLTRNPDVLVGLWDLMGVTKVQSSRVGPYQIRATDGQGTTCDVDLVYGDTQQHIFVADGAYDGSMVTSPVRGSGVFVLSHRCTPNSSGGTTVTGTLDCFLQLESLGADLIARSLSPIIGRSADSNFEQTAKFMAQVDQASNRNPGAMLDIAGRLPQVTPPTRKAFGNVIVTVARKGPPKIASARR